MVGKALVFDIFSTYAHFRKNYTTTSPLSFSIPPFSALRGIIAAILGLKSNEYPELLSPSNLKIGVSILNPISKIRIMTNYINTTNTVVPLKKGSEQPRIQVRIEYIKNPRYRIYFTASDESLYERLKSHLKNHYMVYTPYLGIANCIANYHFIGEFSYTEKKINGDTELHSVIPKSIIKTIKIIPGARYLLERVPYYLDSSRKPENFVDVLFNAEGIQSPKGMIAGHIDANVYKIDMEGEPLIVFL